MALINLTQFEGLVASYIPFVGQAIDFRREKEVEKALVTLYDQADAIAILLVQNIAAFLWWAAHIASAANDVFYYSTLVERNAADTDRNNLETWTAWLNDKYPTDLRKLYADLLADVTERLRKGAATQAESLKKLEAEIAALDKWKVQTVTPDLKAWNTFYHAWKETYLPPVQTLTRWLRSPKEFAAWALPPIIVQMPAALRKPSMLRYSTAIEQAFLTTWASDPQPVYDAVLNWLVTGS